MKNAVPSEKIGTGAAFFSPNAWTHRKNVSSSVASRSPTGVSHIFAVSRQAQSLPSGAFLRFLPETWRAYSVNPGG